MHPHRKERVANTIRNLVSDIIAHRLQDPRVDRMTTVTRVVMSGDLLAAKVYVSVHGGGAPQRRTLTAIRHAGGYIRRLVARDLTMRQCPELRFEIDEAVEQVRRTMELLDENRRHRLEQQEANGEEDVPGPETLGKEGETDSTALGRPQETDE